MSRKAICPYNLALSKRADVHQSLHLTLVRVQYQVPVCAWQNCLQDNAIDSLRYCCEASCILI